MKKLTLVALLFVFAISFANAQSKKAKQFGDDLCNCLEKVFTPMHPAIKKMMTDMAEFGEEQAQKNFEKYAGEHPGEMEAIQASMAELESIDKKMDEQCASMKEKYSKEELSEQDKNGAIEYLKNKKKCALALMIIKKGF
jgi:hypothetical protein